MATRPRPNGGWQGNGNGAAAAERPLPTISKAVGLYQTLLRRQLEHFFPEASLEAGSDRSFAAMFRRSIRTRLPSGNPSGPSVTPGPW